MVSINSQDAVTSYNKGAIYFQDIISMMNEKLLLFVGGRYDTDSNPDLFNDNFSPRISAVYTATNDLTLRASAARAHRFPATSEDLADLTIPFAEFSPNSELKEEKIKTFEFVSYTSNHSETRFFPL